MVLHKHEQLGRRVGDVGRCCNGCPLDLVQRRRNCIRLRCSPRLAQACRCIESRSHASTCPRGVRDGTQANLGTLVEQPRHPDMTNFDQALNGSPQPSSAKQEVMMQRRKHWTGINLLAARHQ